MKGMLLIVGLALFAAMLPAGCAPPPTHTCVTHFATCRAEQAGPPGHACVCRYPSYAKAGIYEGGE